MEKETIDNNKKQNLNDKMNDNDNSILKKIILDIKRDLKNINNFWKNNKKTIFWIFIIFIALQYIDIISLGKSFNNICNNNKLIQNGGDGDVDKTKTSKGNKGGSSYKPFQAFKTSGPLGNVFGKFGTIFQNAFKVIGAILLIAVIGFLPIIVLIVMTYKVVSFMVLKVRHL